MKNCTFFEESENLPLIIEKTLNGESIKKLDILPTGWTNTIFDVKCDKNNYIFRFPRNQFFSKKILVDEPANKFLKDNIKNFNYLNIKTYYDEKKRPFTIHEKVTGEDLYKKIKYLSKIEKDAIAEKIAEFYLKLHNIKINDNHPKILKNKLSNFLDELAKVDDDSYNYSYHDIIKEEEEKELVYVHGDLNIKNILLADDNSLGYIIDYTFFGLSSRYSDLGRMCSLVDRNFIDSIFHYYSKKSNFKINYNTLEKHINCWNYVEKQYINYIRNYQKGIDLTMY